MRSFLYEKLSKNPIVDNVNKNINATIDEFIKYDYLFYVFPVLSKIDIDINADFFKANNISINKSLELNTNELKTISYLAPFFKEKVRYNPKNIIRYLRIIGYYSNYDDVVIECIKNINNPDIEKDYISFEEYLSLPDYETFKSIVKLQTYKNHNGFDIGCDVLVMK